MSCIATPTRALGMLSRRPIFIAGRSISTSTGSQLPGSSLRHAASRTLVHSACMAPRAGSKSLRHYSSVSDVPGEKTAEQAPETLRMEDALRKYVVGQDHVVDTVSEAIRNSRASSEARNQPLASFLFLGPTGVGKTEFCKALAKHLNGDLSGNLIPVNVAESTEPRKLIGAELGISPELSRIKALINAVRVKRNAVILLDGVENAHKDVMPILQEILEKGEITNAGRKVDFRNTVLIFKSDLGSDICRRWNVDDAEAGAKAKNDILRRANEFFPPDFLTRLDSTLVFNKLSRESILKVADLRLNDILTPEARERRLTIDADDAAREWLADRAYSDVYGLRAIKGVVATIGQRKFLNAKLTAGMIKDGEAVRVRVTASGTATILNNHLPDPNAPARPSSKPAYTEQVPVVRRVLVRWPETHVPIQRLATPDIMKNLNTLLGSRSLQVDPHVTKAQISSNGHLVLYSNSQYSPAQLQENLKESLSKSAEDLLACFAVQGVDSAALKLAGPPTFVLDDPCIGIVIRNIPGDLLRRALDSGKIIEYLCRATGYRKQDIRNIRVMCKSEELELKDRLTLRVMFEDSPNLDIEPLVKSGIYLLGIHRTVLRYRPRPWGLASTENSVTATQESAEKPSS